MNCPKCGNELAPNTEVCEKCKEAVAQPAPSAPQKQKKGKNNLALKIVAIVLALVVLLTGGLFITDAVLFSVESKKGDFVTDFPILKQKTDLLVYDAEKFPYENYNIKVERFKTGKIFKSSTFSGFENVINEKSSNPIFSIDFKEDGKYHITLEGIVSSRTQAVTESTTKKEEPKTVVIIVIVDNDNEKAVDKVTINSKKDDKPIEDLEVILSSGGKFSGENGETSENAAVTKNATFTLGANHAVGIKNDGSVVAVGVNNYGQCNVSNWKDIVYVTAGWAHTVGVKSDGTVVATGYNEDGQCNVTDWKDIIAVEGDSWHTVGLKSDGTVVATGSNDDGECNVSDWTDIVAISVGDHHTVGLRSDGTVVAVGSNHNGECDVSDWKDIVAIDAGYFHTVGLKSDGTVVVVGDTYDESNSISSWKNIVDVCAGDTHTVGLKSDGTVVAAGNNAEGRCDVEGWTDIIAVFAGANNTAGFKSDGTLVVVGWDQYGMSAVSEMKDIRVPGKNNASATPSVPATPSAPEELQGAEDIAVKYLEAVWSGCDLKKMSQIELFGYESMLDALDERAKYKYHAADSAAYKNFAERCNAEFSDAEGCFAFLADEAYKEYSPELEYGSGYSFEIDVASSRKIEKAEAFGYIDGAEDPAKGVVPADKMEEKYASLTDFSVVELRGTRSGSNKSDEMKMEIVLGYDGEKWYVLGGNGENEQNSVNMGFAILRGLMEYFMN